LKDFVDTLFLVTPAFADTFVETIILMKTKADQKNPVPEKEDHEEMDFETLKKLIKRKKLQTDGLKKIIQQINQSQNKNPES
jgi:hypothetical protein